MDPSFPKALGQFAGMANVLTYLMILADNTLKLIACSSVWTALDLDKQKLCTSTEADNNSCNGSGKPIVMSMNDIAAINLPI